LLLSDPDGHVLRFGSDPNEDASAQPAIGWQIDWSW
jgi:hypothetical protein